MALLVSCYQGSCADIGSIISRLNALHTTVCFSHRMLLIRRLIELKFVSKNGQTPCFDKSYSYY